MICAQKRAVTEARKSAFQGRVEPAGLVRPLKERPVEDLTGLVCWWCVHPFPEGATASIHVPTRYDDRRDVFTTRGRFCSWQCAKAWVLDQNSARSGEIQMYLSQMRLRALGRHVPFWPAPKREALKIFGGTMEIDEFRKFGGQIEPPILYWPDEHRLVPVSSSSAEKQSTGGSATIAVASDRRRLAAIETATASSDTLKLRRTKPLARTESKLENVLGITRKVK